MGYVFVYVAMEMTGIPIYAYFNLPNLVVLQSPMIVRHIGAFLYSNIAFS
jgi:hypothetical protein